MTGPRLVDRRPYRRAEHRTAVHAARLERGLAPNEQPYGFRLPAVRGPVKRVQPGPGPSSRVNPAVEKELDDTRPAKEAGAGEGLRQCRRLRREVTLVVPLDDLARAALQRPILEQRCQAREVAPLKPLEGFPEQRDTRVFSRHYSLSLGWPNLCFSR